MTKELIQKNIKLSAELDQYISGNPSVFRGIPAGANIIITSAGDSVLSAANISIAKSSRSSKLVEAHKSGGKWVFSTFKRA
ncbi:MAG: DUF5647 family protein [Candidatus Paceibacterota bacterium]|jgi:hypothetical protein